MELVKYTLVEGGTSPVKATEGAAAFDLFSRVPRWDDEAGYLEVFLGVKFEIPKGYVGKLYPRSSISNYGLHMANSVGIIDSDFRGEVRARFYPSAIAAVHKYDNKAHFIESLKLDFAPGKATAQIIFEKLDEIVLVPVEEELLSSTDRGEGGFGSTDK